MKLKYRIIKNHDPDARYQYGYQYKWTGLMSLLDGWSDPCMFYETEEEATNRVLMDIEYSKERAKINKTKNKNTIIKEIES